MVFVLSKLDFFAMKAGLITFEKISVLFFTYIPCELAAILM